MLDVTPDRPLCPGCGEPLGTYEPLWRISPRGAERTAWLRLGPRDLRLESLWHATCAEEMGIEGG